MLVAVVIIGHDAAVCYVGDWANGFLSHDSTFCNYSTRYPSLVSSKRSAVGRARKVTNMLLC
ncbi:hypothetical protein ACHWQZ_G017513 [Mnemiopsis leidyi]